ncbi:MAG: hypothetical protein U0350_44740 [Caldilineaceae bacterium]
MKHMSYSRKLVAALCAAIALFVLTLPAKPEPVQPAADQTGGGIALQPPAFLKSAHAADANAAVTDTTQVDFSFLLDEAGVTAYTKLDQSLDLASLESDFKTIGRKTDEFISGIIIAPGYEYLPEFGENAEVQVFLHHDGWIAAYLTRYQTASALFDWVSYDEKRLKDSTLIENVVRKLAEDAGVSDINVAYYDFRNLQATNLILAADHADANKTSESFEINIPRQLTVYESSWSSAQFGIAADYQTRWRGSCTLNGETLASHDPGGERWGLWSGELAKAKLPPDTNHKLSVAGSGKRSYCGIAIVYREATK